MTSTILSTRLASRHTISRAGKITTSVVPRSSFHTNTSSSRSSLSSILATASASASSSSSLNPHRRLTPLAQTHVRHFARKFGDGGQSAQGQQPHEEAEQKSSEGDKAGEKPEEEGNAVVGVLIIVGVIGGAAYFIFRKPAPEDEEPFYVTWPRSIKGLIYGNSPLLPPETLDATGRRPRTVILNFDKTLVHCDWTRNGGWEVRKRPGVDRMIERLHMAGYELILWANMPAFEVEPTLAELDPLGYFKHKLYNESTNYKLVEGSRWPSLVKDLSRLQRDPKRLIVIDTSNAKYSPIDGYENVMLIKEFTDDLKDKELTTVLKILEDVKRFNTHDVTSVIRRFNSSPNKEIDFFEKERAAAEEASRNLRGDKNKGKKQQVVQQKDDDDDDDEQPNQSTQSWGSWLKSFVVSAK